ncbi:hypothetical protein Fmac_032573 [Flemingia macrophylla]|uniref:DUF4283 domain-containing protein n=1 Tax=Flemingia macrophylla TaxID=520843 RepID=A0ABD1L599_9FABA
MFSFSRGDVREGRDSGLLDLRMCGMWKLRNKSRIIFGWILTNCELILPNTTKDVVKGNAYSMWMSKDNLENVWRNDEEWKGVFFNSRREIKDRLHRCFVGEIRREVDAYDVQDLIWDEGLHLIRATPLGGWKALEVDRERIIWIRLERVPIHAWERDFFMLICDLHADTENLHKLDYAHMKIKTKVGSFINRLIKVKIDNLFFEVNNGMSGSVSSSKWRELMISKKATIESVKEVWDFGRTLGLVCEDDEEEVINTIRCQEVRDAENKKEERRVSQRKSTILYDFLWGGAWNNFVFKASKGLVGGLLILWDSSIFSISEVFEGNHYIGVKRQWSSKEVAVTVINVYAPCIATRQMDLWNELCSVIQARNEPNFCIMGDFNDVRNSTERRGI